MSKRKDGRFKRNERDFYPTPAKAVMPLLPHLKPGTRFIEPCAGEGHLVGHLKRVGHVLVGASICPSTRDRRAMTSRTPISSSPIRRTAARPATKISCLRFLVNLSNQAPLWALVDGDWLFTRASAPFMPRLVTVIAIGRVRWIAAQRATASTTMPGACSTARGPTVRGSNSSAAPIHPPLPP